MYTFFPSKPNKMINRDCKIQSIAAMLIGLVFHVLELTKIKLFQNTRVCRRYLPKLKDKM